MSDKSAEGRRDPAVLRALLDRVQAAKGPDQRLNEAIHDVFFPGSWDRYEIDEAPGVTASIDACVTLLGHVLPQSAWSVCDMENGPAAVIIRPMPDGGYIGGGMYAEAATPPLAFLAAILRSLIANAEEGH